MTIIRVKLTDPRMASDAGTFRVYTVIKGKGSLVEVGIVSDKAHFMDIALYRVLAYADKHHGPCNFPLMVEIVEGSLHGPGPGLQG